jgi:hypothetical protein
VGISAAIVPHFRSPVTFAVSRADFSLPVSASKNSVPRSRVAAAKAVRELGNLGSFSGQNRPFESGPYLSRVQSEGFELLAPFWRSIAKSLDADAARQPTFHGGPHEIWREKRE